MSLLLNNCFEVIRKAPLFSAVGLPWQLEGEVKLCDKFMFLPRYTPESEYIQATLSRLLAASFVPHLALPCASANAGLGGAHLILALFRKRTQEEVEKGLIRLCTAVYDLAVHFLLMRSYPYSGWMRGAFYIGFTAFPTLLHQLHGFIVQNESSIIKCFANKLAAVGAEMHLLAPKSAVASPPGEDILADP